MASAASMVACRPSFGSIALDPTHERNQSGCASPAPQPLARKHYGGPSSEERLVPLLSQAAEQDHDQIWRALTQAIGFLGLSPAKENGHFQQGATCNLQIKNPRSRYMSIHLKNI